MRADISCSSAVVLATPTEPTDNDLNIGQHSAGSVFLSTSSCVYDRSSVHVDYRQRKCQ